MKKIISSQGLRDGIVGDTIFGNGGKIVIREE